MTELMRIVGIIESIDKELDTSDSFRSWLADKPLTKIVGEAEDVVRNPVSMFILARIAAIQPKELTICSSVLTGRGRIEFTLRSTDHIFSVKRSLSFPDKSVWSVDEKNDPSRQMTLTLPSGTGRGDWIVYFLDRLSNPSNSDFATSLDMKGVFPKHPKIAAFVALNILNKVCSRIFAE
ncbi:MAG: hypothetical protein WBB28_01970 [Crinalium sp.]